MSAPHWADPAMWEPAPARPGVPWRHGWDVANVAPYGQAPRWAVGAAVGWEYASPRFHTRQAAARYATELKGNQP